MLSLKVIHLNAQRSQGGAARAVGRLHAALRNMGVDSLVSVQARDGAFPDVIGPETRGAKLLALARRAADSLAPRIVHDVRVDGRFSAGLFGRSPRKDILAHSPDVLNLHWLAGGFVAVSSLTQITVPVAWTLHDLWPFTGGCHVDENCYRYKDNCGYCPLLQSSHLRDLSYFGLRKKRHFFVKRTEPLVFVAPSHWIAERARESALLKQRPVEVIKNGVDLKVFKPIDKTIARHVLGLPIDCRLVLFGAFGASNPGKGLALFSQAWGQIAERHEMDGSALVIFGSEAPPEISTRTPIHSVGFLHDETSLALLYAASDVFVVASLRDNLPNTVMEAMACGLPCVAFGTGGIPDMIDHQVDGYLAEPFRVEDLAHGIRWILEDKSRHSELAQKARESAERKFDVATTARQYLELYSRLTG